MQTNFQFTNRFANALPADSETENFCRQVEGACYSRVEPLTTANPTCVAFSEETAELLGLRPEDCGSEEFTQIFTGNKILPGMDPFAMCYGGHQFGNWAGQLGDGRAIVLGEIINNKKQHFTLQLKGAGPTPYSRTADGLAVLRSSVREFLCSEAMHHLGIPTTRALSLTLSGNQVVRDMLYDGNPKPEPGAVVCRVSESFIRFGNFEILAARGETELLRQLADFTITHHFEHLRADGTPESYVNLFSEVVEKTASMIIEWMRVGFVHGVMNTDNMSILGETIDYGPYGWLENYDPDWTPNTTDSANRRYRYGQQPAIAQWNLLQLANALFPLIKETKPLEEALAHYADQYQSGWNGMMAHKLGLLSFREEDKTLLGGLGKVLQLTETDMTLFFRLLANLSHEKIHNDPVSQLLGAYYKPDEINEHTDSGKNKRNLINQWLESYVRRAQSEKLSDVERTDRMNSVNPLYVMRNYLAQIAIDEATEGNYDTVRELLDTMRRPYSEQRGRESFAEKRPEWARTKVGCSMLSCSS